MPTPRHGESVPLVTSPPPTHRVALARDAGAVDRERDELLRRAGRAHGAHGLGADEAGVLLAAPAEPGLDRAALDAQVVAVEVKAGLQAQRVARGEPGGRRRRGARARPTAPGRRRARAAARRRPRRCSRCRTRAPRRAASRRPRARPSCARAAARRRSPARSRARAGPARRASRSRRCGRPPRASQAAGVRAKPLQVALVVGGVGDRQVALARPGGR